METSQVRAIEWRDGCVVLIDQRLLPGREVYVSCRDWREVAEAIRTLAVRGAPAIGVAAAMAMAQGAREAAQDPARFEETLQATAEVLFSTRPTAVNLGWALEEMGRVWRRSDLSVAERVELMERRAVEIYEEDLAACRRIGELGADLILGGLLEPERSGGDQAARPREVQKGASAPGATRPERRPPVILTHCNAGALATAGYGTALGVVRSLHARDPRVRVLADETRPLLQGARLTAWELQRDAIQCHLITDGMAGHFLRSGEITHVVVGADRIAANGDTANKIGTYGVAVLARENGVPFVVAAPLSTVDLSVAQGEDIPIEERAADEVTHLGGQPVAAPGAGVRNPSFDVTPARYISAIVTERGVALPPFSQALRKLASTREGES